MDLSQTTDADASTVPLGCCLEVKERGGDYNEAIIQLGIWCAAGLERLRGLWVLGRSRRGSGRAVLFDLDVVSNEIVFYQKFKGYLY
jgi:hypothetical protein